MNKLDTWHEAQKWEKSWWGNCTNTIGEDLKQFVYAQKMGLDIFENKKSPYNINAWGKNILDVGGGPTSLLLKCENLGECTVIDPCEYPDWVKKRYELAGIEYIKISGEEFVPWKNDEVWIYNVLQHTKDPEKIIENAKNSSSIIRIFEWIDTETNAGHPHSLTKEKLDTWLGGEGKTEYLNGQNGCFGNCYYGIFRGCYYK